MEPEPEKQASPIIPIMGMMLLLVLMSIYILNRAWHGHNEPALFWAMWIFSVLLLVYLAFGQRYAQYFYCMLIFQIMVGVIWIWGQSSPLPTGSDAIFESQYAGTIISSGHWDVFAGEGMAKNYYGYSPLIHFNMASISLLTGLDVYTIGKVFPLLERVLYFTVMYFVLRRMTSEKVAALATLFIFCSSPLILIHTSRRLFAEPFFLLVLFALFFLLGNASSKMEKRKYLALLMLFTIAVMLGHHMTVYFLMFTLFAIFAYRLAQKLRQGHDIPEAIRANWLVSVSLLAMFLIGLSILLHSGILDRDLGRLSEGLSALFAVNASSADSAISSIGSASQYPSAYVMLTMVFVMLFYLLLLASFLRYMRKSDNYFLAGWSLSSAFLLFIPVAALLTGTRVGRLFGTVGWGIGAIGMSMLVAKLLWDWWKSDKLHRKPALAILVVALYCGGLLIAYPIQHYVSEVSEPTINNQTVFAGRWLEEQTERTDVLGGDRISYDVFSGVNLRYMRYDTNGLFFAGTQEGFRNNMTEYADKYAVRHYVFNEVVTRVQAVGFGLVQPENLGWFDGMYGLDRVYSNGEVHIYRLQP